MQPPVLAIDARLANARQRAGVGTFCNELLRALPPVLGDWRLLLYLDESPRDGFPLSPQQAEIRVLPRRRGWTQRALPRALLEDRPAVFLSPVTQLPLHCPGKCIAAVMDLAYVSFAEHFTLRQRVLARVQTAWCVRRADLLLSLSEATQRDLQRLYCVPPERAPVVLAGPSPQFVAPKDGGEAARVRAALKLPGRFVLYLGRLQPRKNIPHLVESFAQVVARHPELPHHLVIAGDRGWMYDGIYAAAQASPARERIHFTGFVEDADVPGLVAAADVLALVSLWEGFGLPVIEAMACGTAVLTSNTSSLPEVAGDAAALADPCDVNDIARQLERLLLDDAYRSTLAARGPAQAAKFTWGETAARVMRAVESVHQSR